jgi:hypothetical protein
MMSQSVKRSPHKAEAEDDVELSSNQGRVKRSKVMIAPSP